MEILDEIIYLSHRMYQYNNMKKQFKHCLSCFPFYTTSSYVYTSFLMININECETRGICPVITFAAFIINTPFKSLNLIFVYLYYLNG